MHVNNNFVEHDCRNISSLPAAGAGGAYTPNPKTGTLFSRPKPRREMAPCLRAGRGGLKLMDPFFSTPRGTATTTASPAAPMELRKLMHVCYFGVCTVISSTMLNRVQAGGACCDL